MELNVTEALRYAAIPLPAPESLRRQMAELANELEKSVTPQYVYRVFPLQHISGGVLLPGTQLELRGTSVETMLEQCDSVALLACTLGAKFDTLLRREQVRDMSRAVLMDACASAWVEAGCDQAQNELHQRLPGRYLTDRFSPGYGDFSLQAQAGICGVVDAFRRLGLTLSDSFLLNPVKSVTAVIGISDRPQAARIRGCDFCSMQNSCKLRKAGKNCGL